MIGRSSVFYKDLPKLNQIDRATVFHSCELTPFYHNFFTLQYILWYNKITVSTIREMIQMFPMVPVSSIHSLNPQITDGHRHGHALFLTSVPPASEASKLVAVGLKVICSLRKSVLLETLLFVFNLDKQEKFYTPAVRRVWSLSLL